MKNILYLIEGNDRSHEPLSTSMDGLIGSPSAHHMNGLHPRANLSPCKQSEFDLQPHN